MQFAISPVDLVVLAILMISGLIAAYRGFLKETLSVSAWLIAALVAVFLWPVTKPLARTLVEPKIVADILALIAVFFMLLIPTSFISFRLSEFVRGSHAGPLDRSLGFVFGVARGLLVVGLGYLIFSSLAPPKSHPDWVKEARLLPMVKGTADVIRSLSGGKTKDTEEAETETAVKEEPTTKEAPEAKHAENSEPKPETKTKPDGKTDTDNKKDGGDKGKSYGANDRREMDRLVRSLSKQ